jgi:tetratricopeptide (TPR) repeat protein
MRQGWAILAVGWLAAAVAAADTVRTREGIGYTGRITGLDETGIVIEVAGARRSIPLREVSEIRAADQPALEQAEKAFAAGAFDRAERAYEALLKAKVPPWLRTLAQSRLLKVYGETQRPAQALDAYLELAQAHPKLVAGLALPKPRRGADRENQAMLRRVEDALAKAANQPYAAELGRLKVALVMEVGSSEQRIELIRQALQSDNPATRQWARLKTLELLLDLKRYDEAEAQLTEAEADLGRSHPAQLAYYRGRVLEARGQHVEAALELMRLPILYAVADRALTAEALWRAGEAMAAARLPAEEIRKVYQEAVRDYAGTPGADQARRALARLGGDGGRGPFLP